MNFPYSNPSPYIQAAMAQAVQAMMSGGPLPPNCVVMSIPYQPGQPIYPQLIMGATGANPLDGSMFPPTNPFFPPTNVTSPFPTNSQTRALVPFANNGQQVPTNYNYPIVSNNKSKKKSKKTNRHQPHSNIYNSSSFDTYMKDLSWSRLFDHHSGKTSNQQQQQQQKTAQDSVSIGTQDEKSNASKQQRSNSSSSSNSSTTSDETIRRVNVTSQQTNHLNGKGTTKGSLPFKYSSEFVPGLAKQGAGPAAPTGPAAPVPPPPSKSKTHETTNVKKA